MAPQIDVKQLFDVKSVLIFKIMLTSNNNLTSKSCLNVNNAFFEPANAWTTPLQLTPFGAPSSFAECPIGSDDTWGGIFDELGLLDGSCSFTQPLPTWSTFASLPALGPAAIDASWDVGHVARRWLESSSARVTGDRHFRSLDLL